MFAILDHLTVKFLTMFRYVRNLKAAIEHLRDVNERLSETCERLQP